MGYSELKSFADTLSKDEIAVILALGDGPYELEIIASEVSLPAHRVQEILIKFEGLGLIRKSHDRLHT